MSSIVTFYSYKGGVGRSMALANVAVLLARRGLRVLAVDWDLEAPGLERYFSSFSFETEGAGLLRMFIDAAEGRPADYRAYMGQVRGDDVLPFSFLPSGRDQDTGYSENLENFDWADFFRKQNGGQFVEELRTQWKKDFEVVLIDSRTGLSDTGGICTIQLPDVVVAMFTANHQSLYGTRDVLRLAQKARQTLAYDRMPLTVLPLPARFGTRAEFREGQEWLERFQEALQEFFDDWLPTTMPAKQLLERIKIPQVDYFAFGEKLAVIEQGTNDPEGMGFVYDKVATLLTSNFSDLEAVVGHSVMQEQIQEAKKKPGKKSRVALEKKTKDYQYDFFVSYQHGSHMSTLVEQLITTLRSELALSLNEVRIFFDVREISLGMAFSESTRDALLHSKLLLVIATPAYFQSNFCMAELLTFMTRSEMTGQDLIIPVVLRGPAYFPDFFLKYQYLDFSKLVLGRRAFQTVEMRRRVRDLADDILRMLEKAPPLDAGWAEVSLAEAEAKIVPPEIKMPALRS